MRWLTNLKSVTLCSVYHTLFMKYETIVYPPHSPLSQTNLPRTRKRIPTTQADMASSHMPDRRALQSLKVVQKKKGVGERECRRRAKDAFTGQDYACFQLNP